MAKAKRDKRRTPRSVKANCDRLFSKLIRSKGKCERCSGTDNLQCAHIYSRKFGSVRFDEDNALCLCAGCHRWGHDNPLGFAALVNNVKGSDGVSLIAWKKEQLVKRKLADWITLEAELKAKLGDK